MHIKRLTRIAVYLWMLMAVITYISVLVFKLEAGLRNFETSFAISSLGLLGLIYIVPGALLLTNRRTGWLAMIILCPLMLLFTVVALLMGSVEISTLSVARVAAGAFLMIMLVVDRPHKVI